jgi:large subunit ribosomal protein L21
MYAIIRTGGHQEKVAVGDQVTVDRLKQEPGETVNFTPLMIHRDDGSIVTDHGELSSQAAVVGKVVQHFRGDKLEVFNYRQKTGYRKHTGHRQPLTLVEISELRLGEVVERAEQRTASTEAERVAEELQRSAQSEDEAPAPKKAAPRKKAPAKAAVPKAAPKAAAKKSTAKKATPKKGS